MPGGRAVLGVDLGPAEDASFWLGFLRSLVARGLRGLQLVISDAHEGLKQAIAQPRFPRVAALLYEAQEDVLAYMAFPTEYHRQIRSTNPLERLNKELKRRADVVLTRHYPGRLGTSVRQVRGRGIADQAAILVEHAWGRQEFREESRTRCINRIEHRR